jgi:KR domain
VTGTCPRSCSSPRPRECSARGNYAAANALLDALAAHRHASGLAATALAWGFWEQRSGMTSHLNESDVTRMRRSGMAPPAHAGGAGAVRHGPDTGRARSGPDAPGHGEPARRASGATARPGTRTGPPYGGRTPRRHGPLRFRLRLRRGPAERAPAGASEDEQTQMVLELVRNEAATVLGHIGADDVDLDRRAGPGPSRLVRRWSSRGGGRVRRRPSWRRRWR